jgi:signal transduction histidine kinase
MRRRLVLSQVLLIALVLLILEVPLGVVYSRHEHDALGSALSRDAASLGALADEVVEQPVGHDVPALAARFSARNGGTVAIVAADGTLLTPLRPPKTQAAFDAALHAALAGRSDTGEVAGIVYVSVPLGSTADKKGAILVGRPDETIDVRVHQFWLVLLCAGIGILGIAVLVSAQLARWVVGPLQQLEDRAEALGHGDMNARAETPAGPPEVVALAATFNEMADRLDELVSSQRRFVADASHQLRTPLTALRLRLENLDASDADAVHETREAALVETGRLTRLVDGLLALARSEAQQPTRSVIAVGPVIEQRVEAWGPLAAEGSIELRHQSGDGSDALALIVPGNLDQVLDNLIANALDATPAGRAVTLGVVQSGRAVEIHVADEGPGMTEEERTRAFDPFWQSPHGRSNGSAGLGLAIVDQLVRASGGTIALQRSNSGGIDAVVRLERAQRATSPNVR